MMLTSGGQPSDAARCRELGITSYLTKPIKQSELLNAIALPSRPSRYAAHDTALLPSPSLTQSQRPLHILLVEDNVVNQRLTVWMLEKWGHSVVVAEQRQRGVSSLSAARRLHSC